MKTPICDFVENYITKKSIRLHVPGHKGNGFLGVEKYDITEIDGADELFLPKGIIKSSEHNASTIFKCPTYYTCEGSSHAIRSMLYLAYLYSKRLDKEFIILSTKNVHKSFLSGVALLRAKVLFIEGENRNNYLDQSLSPNELDNYLEKTKIKPLCLYLTSPNYLGRILDIKGISEVCKKHNILLLVDNAHGGYLHFLKESLHPILLGADMSATSAHKTLPVLTGGAYLQLSEELNEILSGDVNLALTTFGSTSPSYLILQSLDYANSIFNNKYKKKVLETQLLVEDLKNSLEKKGYSLLGNEPFKVVIETKPYGYLGVEIKDLLQKNNIACEFCDNDFLVLMFSTEIKKSAYNKIKKFFYDLPKKLAVKKPIVKPTFNKKVMEIYEAVFAKTEVIPANKSLGRICAEINYSCPPAVPVIICGEVINEETIKRFHYYNIKKIRVVIE